MNKIIGLLDLYWELTISCCTLFRYEQLIYHTKPLSGRTYKLVGQLLEQASALAVARLFSMGEAAWDVCTLDFVVYFVYSGSIDCTQDFPETILRTPNGPPHGTHSESFHLLLVGHRPL